MLFQWDFIYKTKQGYVFQLNVVTISEIEFDLNRIYSYLYCKFDFFNNLQYKLYTKARLNSYYYFIVQGWHPLILNNYLDYYRLYCKLLLDNNNCVIPEFFEVSMEEFKNIFESWKEDKIDINKIYLNNLLTVSDDIEVSKNSLFLIFNKVLNKNLLTFNYNFYLDILLLDDLNILNKEQLLEVMFCNLISKLLKGNVIYVSLLTEFFNINSISYDISRFEFNSLNIVL